MYFNKTDTCVFCLKTSFCLILLSNHRDRSSLQLTSTETIQTLSITVILWQDTIHTRPREFFHCTTVLHVSPILHFFLKIQEVETVKLPMVVADSVLLLVLLKWERKNIHPQKYEEATYDSNVCNGNYLCVVVLFYTWDVNIVKRLEYLWAWKTLLNYPTNWQCEDWFQILHCFVKEKRKHVCTV